MLGLLLRCLSLIWFVLFVCVVVVITLFVCVGVIGVCLVMSLVDLFG